MTDAAGQPGQSDLAIQTGILSEQVRNAVRNAAGRLPGCDIFTVFPIALRAEEQREKIMQASAPHAPVVSARVCFPDHLHLLAGEEGIVGIMYTR